VLQNPRRWYGEGAVMADLPIPDLLPALPELVLALGAMALLMLGAYRERSTPIVNLGAIMLLVAAAFIAVTLPNATTFGGSFVVDDFARFFKLLVFVGSALAIVLSLDYLAAEREQKFEFAILILLSTVGMGMLISAADLIALYLGLELMSLSLYVVAASSRDSVRSTEAGLKYFVLGALSSGMLLYGCSLIYGFTGNVSFAGIAKASAQTSGQGGIGLIFGLVFLFAGFCFKVSAVPFHMWTPDVYEGAPTPVTAFFAAAPKIAAIAIFARATISAFPGIVLQWQQIVVFVAIASMALGAFAAIGQRNIKRLMAYSSIGHMGFALIGLAAGTAEGIQGVLVYMAIYLAMTLGTFAVILSMRRPEGMVEQISDLAGLARSNPPLAFFLALLLFSLAGIPPLAGFFAKYYVFLAAIQAGLYALAVIGVLASVVGAYYYLLIVKIMYFDEPAPSFVPMPGELKVVLGLAGLFNLLYFLYPAPLIVAAGDAAKSLF
jgi:NADH-quinone oxidoreductase subunit N